MRFFVKLSIALCLLSQPLLANDKTVPTVDELIQIKTIGGATISPDGKWIVYSVRAADFEEDAYITHLWLLNTATKASFQLTRGDKSAFNAQWSPDGQWLTFSSGRNEGKNQLYAIRPVGGEAVQLSNVESGVGGYEWSPDGRMIAFTMTDAESKTMKDRKKHYGAFDLVRREYRHAQLWTISIDSAMQKPQKGVQRTKGDFHVRGFEWSPDGQKIAFDAAINSDLVNIGTADIFIYDFAADSAYKIVEAPGPDNSPHWSPDGSQILYTTQMGRELYFAYNSNYALIPATGGEPKIITEDFDEHPGFVEWRKDGIYFSALQKTASHIFHLDPKLLKINRLTSPDDLMAGSFSFTKDGKKMAFVADTPTSMREIYLTDVRKFKPEKLTSMTEQAENFKLATREVISWKSQDGTEIEGVLMKPADFDPSKKYPLLCVIHGGPTGIDRPGLLSRGTRYYPVDIWTGRGALVLRVNYRGSAGYGEKFRTLNMNNLGVGDAWDVISGVDHLIEKGWVDRDKVGCMGWSQGGYISAFLTTSSDRFAAISVGAGISNWATYYYNTDITQFTINYLGDDPADDPKIYEKTSPMTHILKAKTPTLIQHGEFDRRVPIPNAYELRQGLEDRGVSVEMVVYKGYGHGISKPKSQRAVMQHNLAWFNHYLFGDEKPDLAALELPEKK